MWCKKLQRLALTGVTPFIGLHHAERKSPVQFPVRAQAWVEGSVPRRACTRSNCLMFLSCITVSLPLNLPPFPSLKMNKIFKKIREPSTLGNNFLFKLPVVSNSDKHREMGRARRNKGTDTAERATYHLHDQGRGRYLNGNK